MPQDALLLGPFHHRPGGHHQPVSHFLPAALQQLLGLAMWPAAFCAQLRSALLSQKVKGIFKCRDGPRGHQHRYASHDLDIKIKNLQGHGLPSLANLAWLARGAASRFTKCNYSHPGKEAVQPLSATTLGLSTATSIPDPWSESGLCFHELFSGCCLCQTKPGIQRGRAGPGQSPAAALHQCTHALGFSIPPDTFFSLTTFKPPDPSAGG